MKELLRRQNSEVTSCQVFPATLLDTSAGNCQRALVDESGMIINQMETHNNSKYIYSNAMKVT
jgi:hypothetical protein